LQAPSSKNYVRRATSSAPFSHKKSKLTVKKKGTGPAFTSPCRTIMNEALKTSTNWESVALWATKATASMVVVGAVAFVLQVKYVAPDASFTEILVVIYECFVDSMAPKSAKGTTSSYKDLTTKSWSSSLLPSMTLHWWLIRVPNGTTVEPTLKMLFYSPSTDLERSVPPFLVRNRLWSRASLGTTVQWLPRN